MTDRINEEYYLNGVFHSYDDKPAKIYADGTMQWYINGYLVIKHWN